MKTFNKLVCLRCRSFCSVVCSCLKARPSPSPPSTAKPRRDSAPTAAAPCPPGWRHVGPAPCCPATRRPGGDGWQRLPRCYRARCPAFGRGGQVASVQRGAVSSPSLGRQQAPHKAAAVAASPRPGLRQVSVVSGFSLRVCFPDTGAGVLPGR